MRNTKLALWSLIHRPDCRIEGDRIYDGRTLIFTEFHGLMLDGYVDPRGVVTDLGRRLVERPLSRMSVSTAMHKIQAGEPITRYCRLRMIHEGLIEETPGGGLRKVDKGLKRVVLWLTEDQRLLIDMMLAKR
jgi:hypothetical protein